MKVEYKLTHDVMFLLVTLRDNLVVIDDGDGGEIAIECQSRDEGKRKAADVIDELTSLLESLKKRILE